MADFNINVVFNGSYQFEKLQSDLAQTDPLARDYIKNQPDWDNMIFDSVTTDELIMGGETTTWDDAEGTLSTTLPDGGSLQHGKEIFDYYTNVDTVTLVEGDVVCIKQIPGNRKAVKRLDPSQRVDAFSVVGVVTVPTIAVNAVGRVTKIGHVTPYNTASWSDNDSLWVSSANIGKLTNVQPDAGVYSVKVGHVVVSAVSGTIDVRIQVIPKVRDLSDMDGVPLNTEGQFYILQADGTFSANKNINDYYTKTEADNLFDDKVDTSLVGAANGLATLGADGLVPSTQLPAYVDDVLEFANLAAFPATGETGKIYVALDTNKTYRWSGSVYIYITSGAVDSVAGKTGVVTLVKSDVGLGNVDNTSDVNKPISTATQTALNGKVNNTGNETIAGVKTFSSSPLVPDVPASDQSAVNKQFVVGTANSAITKAQQWAENPEDVEVEPGKYSSLHWAAKAQESAESIEGVTGQVIENTQSISTIENVINSMNPNQENRVTVTGVDTISLPKTAANTGMQVQVFGQSATNLVNGANIPAGGSVTFATISGHKYYVSNQAALITGDGNNYTSTNSGATTINIIVVNLTATFGGGNEPTVGNSALLFPTYFAGTDNVMGTGMVRSVGKNLFDKTNVVLNATIDASGVQQTSTTSNATRLIRVQPSTAYIFSGKATASNVAFYDKTGVFISSSSVANASVTSPSTAYYVRFGVVYAQMDTCQMERGTVATAVEPFRQSALYIQSPELRSNGLIKDEIRKGTNGYELVKRVGVGTLGSELITNAADREFSSDTGWWAKTAGVTINDAGSGTAYLPNTQSLYKTNLAVAGKVYRIQFTIISGGIGLSVGGFALDFYSTGTKTVYWKAVSNGSLQFQSRANSVIDNVSFKELSVVDGALTGITATELGSNVHYTLATPTITPIAHGGLLNSNSNGTTYFEPVVADAGVYGTNLAIQLTDYPIASFESIRKYANGTYTELSTATAVIAGDGLSFTHPNLASGDLVMFTYNYNKESIGRSMTLTHYDSRVAIADTANGKVYTYKPVITNGVITSWTLTEV